MADFGYPGPGTEPRYRAGSSKDLFRGEGGSDEYDPLAEYTRSTDQKGHRSSRGGIQFPQVIADRIDSLVNVRADIFRRSPAAFIRSATIHHLAEWADFMDDPDTRQVVNLGILVDKVVRHREEDEDYAILMDTLEVNCSNMTSSAFLADYVNEHLAAAEGVPERFRDEYVDWLRDVRDGKRPKRRRR